MIVTNFSSKIYTDLYIQVLLGYNPDLLFEIAGKVNDFNLYFTKQEDKDSMRVFQGIKKRIYIFDGEELGRKIDCKQILTVSECIFYNKVYVTPVYQQHNYNVKELIIKFYYTDHSGINKLNYFNK